MRNWVTGGIVAASAVLAAWIGAGARQASACGRCLVPNCCCVQTCCAPQPACQWTVEMRPCRQIVWERQQVQGFRVCYEPVREQRVVRCVRYVPEIQQRQQTCTVFVPVRRTVEREVCQVVCRPVREVREVQVCTGRWEDRPAPFACGVPTCAPVTTCRPTTCRVWVPEIQRRQVECVRYVTECVRRRVPVEICTWEARSQVVQIPCTVYRPVEYQRTVECVRWVPRQVPCVFTRCVPREVVVQVPVRVCRPVAAPPAPCAPAQPACCGT